LNKNLRSKLQTELKNQSDLQISEQHLIQTMREAHIAYQNRRQRERIRYSAFLLRQVRFVGAAVWMLQSFLLLCAFWIFRFADLGTVSNFAPRHLPVLLGCFAVFIAMTSIPFLGRSIQYGMLEIEMATRISIPKLLLTRIFIICISNVLLLTVSFLLVRTKAEFGMGSVVLYLLLPYLIACCGFLFIQTYTHSRYQGFVSTSFCFSLIALLLVLYKTAPVVYEQASIAVWGGLCVLCGIILIIGIYHLLDKAISLDLSTNGI
jgi:hypothetical protein